MLHECPPAPARHSAYKSKPIIALPEFFTPLKSSTDIRKSRVTPTSTTPTREFHVMSRQRPAIYPLFHQALHEPIPGAELAASAALPHSQPNAPHQVHKPAALPPRFQAAERAVPVEHAPGGL